MSAIDKLKKVGGSFAAMYAPWTQLGKETKAKQHAAHVDRANKLKEKKAAAEGKTLEEKKEEVNAPYLATQKNIASQSLAGSNNNNSFDDVSIQLDTTQLPSAKDPNVTETAAQAQAKLDSPSEDSTPSDTGAYQTTSDEIEEKAVEIAEKDPKARYKMSSIWDAYRNGDIDEDTRDYLMLDAISASVHNFAQDQGKIAAAYGGGEFNPDYKESAWDARNAEMMKQGISSEASTVEGSDKEMERTLQKIEARRGVLGNEQTDIMLSAARNLKDLAGKAGSQTERALLSALASDVSDGKVDGEAMIAIGAATGIPELLNLFKGKDK